MPVVNQRLGDSITVAGLLMAEDIIAALQEQGTGDVVLLPRVTFDHPERISLDDRTPAQVAEALGVPVVLADTMGDVWDALLGESSVVYR